MRPNCCITTLISGIQHRDSIFVLNHHNEFRYTPHDLLTPPPPLCSAPTTPRRTLTLDLAFLDLYFNYVGGSELLWALVSSFVNWENYTGWSLSLPLPKYQVFSMPQPLMTPYVCYSRSTVGSSLLYSVIQTKPVALSKAVSVRSAHVGKCDPVTHF